MNNLVIWKGGKLEVTCQHHWHKKQNNPKKDLESGEARKAKGQKGRRSGEGIFAGFAHSAFSGVSR